MSLISYNSYLPHKQPLLRIVLGIVVYYSEFYPIFQNLSVVFRTTRKDSTGRLSGVAVCRVSTSKLIAPMQIAIDECPK